MRITDLLNARHPFPSLEIVPPLSGISKDELLENIAPLMEFKPRYINVTTHRDEVRFDPQPDGTFVRKIVRSRVSPVAVCGSIQGRYDVEVVPHIICAGHTAAEIEWLVQDFHYMGIDNIMALRGDSLSGEKRFTPAPGGFAHADEMVRAIRAMEGTGCPVRIDILVFVAPVSVMSSVASGTVKIVIRNACTTAAAVRTAAMRSASVRTSA